MPAGAGRGVYHDVGKIRAPQFFSENQRDENPHDSPDPRESARILRAHVTDGVELVSAHRMGGRIADFVREHHGTGAMRLPREKAGTSGAASDDDFTYPGPRPRSRETAIVMLADQIEATARAAPPSDAAACEEVVGQTIARIREEGQLEDSGLTRNELRTIHRALARALSAMHHRRITYPPAGRPPAGRLRLLPRLLARGRTSP